MSTHEPPRSFNFTCDDDEEYFIPLNKMPQILWSIALAPVSSTIKPDDSLIMGDEHLSTIPEKESGRFIKFSVEGSFFQSMIASDFEGSRACGFVHRPLELYPRCAGYIWVSNFLDLID
ncbi:hypothetical protein Tco_0722531 [Tanacetum coccineum]